MVDEDTVDNKVCNEGYKWFPPTVDADANRNIDVESANENPRREILFPFMGMGATFLPAIGSCPVVALNLVVNACRPRYGCAPFSGEE